jgi:hypothetical protein
MPVMGKVSIASGERAFPLGDAVGHDAGGVRWAMPMPSPIMKMMFLILLPAALPSATTSKLPVATEETPRLSVVVT